jgi:hypothetical protein
MAPDMISLPSQKFRRVAAAFLLVLTAGCQGQAPGERTHEWVGTLPRRDTGFDKRTWQDTSVTTVNQLMERLPDRIDSAAEHRLARNLLISITDAPQGDDGGGALLALRVEALMRIGNAGDAAALARAGRTPPRDAASAQREAEAELLAGNIEMGCIDLRALAARSSTRWVEDGVALCRVRAGEPGAVAPAGSGRLGALARIAGAPLPAEPSSGDPAVTIAYRAAVGSDPRVPGSQRLDAAFAAARASALSGDAYAKILRSAHAQGALAEGPPASGGQAAALFRAIEVAGDPARKLALAERGLLSPGGTVDGVSAAMAEALRGVKAEAGPLAAGFAAYFYTVGDVKAATPWSDLAKRSGADTAVWPYRALVKPPGAAELAQWEKRAHLDPARHERIVAILSAFGLGTADVSEPSQDGLRELDNAAAQQHVGETTLRTLAILGTQGPAGAGPQALRHVLAALDRVNLHDEARAIAFEAMAAVLVSRPAPRKGEVTASNRPAAGSS